MWSLNRRYRAPGWSAKDRPLPLSFEARWFWPGVSKLTAAFAYVVPIMTANNPLLKSAALRPRLFVSHPDDQKLSPPR